MARIKRLFIPYGWVTLLCVVAGVWAVVAHGLIFPFLSNNTDEAVYLFQANTLLKGKLWLENTPLSPFFTTWFERIQADRIVFKYTPVHASLLAAVKYLTGHFELSLSAIAAALTLSMYGFCREMTGTRSTALLATAFLLLSPLWLIQSATFLPYGSFLALVLCFATCCARGLRTQSGLLMACSGVALGLAIFARPYDGVLFATAWFGLYPAWKSDWRRYMRSCIWAGVGAAPVLLLMLLFNASTTGHPLQFPFKQDPMGTFGFGLKRVYEGVGYSYFDFDSLMESTEQSLWQLALWSFGGIVTVALAFFYLLKKKLHRKDYVLLAILAIFPVGYCFFWGMLNLMVWGALYYLGPYYYLPCMVPLSIYAARAIRILLRVYRQAALLLMVIIMPLISGYMFLGIAKNNLAFTAKFDDMYHPFRTSADIRPEHNIVFVPPAYGKYLLHPYRMLSNGNEDQDIFKYAVNRGSENFTLFDAYPGYNFLRYDVFGAYGENADYVNGTALVPLRLQEKPQQLLAVHAVAPPKTQWARICIIAGETSRCVINAPSRPLRAYDIAIRVTPQDITLVSAKDSGKRLPVPPIKGLALKEGVPLQLRAEFSYSGGPHYVPDASRSLSYEYRYFMRKTSRGLQVIQPPEKWEHDDQVKNWFIGDSPQLTVQ